MDGNTAGAFRPDDPPTPNELRIAELEAALRPFADYYTPSMELAGSGHNLTQGSRLAHKQITVGDVRHAYKTLNK